MPRTAFLDFEASSLGKTSWPVEVAWVFDDGEAETHLIRPAPTWTDWSEKASRIHGISLGHLRTEGTPHDVVAARMVERLTGSALYATAPSWDGKWLSVLLRGAGLPRHALRLQDTTVAHRAVALQMMAAAGVPDDEREQLLRRVLDDADRPCGTEAPPAHRALPDAQHELALWRRVRQRAWEAAGRTDPIPA